MGQRESKQARMRELVKEWQASGEPSSRFAGRHGMSENGFRYWRLRFEATRPRKMRSRPVAFAPVRVVDDGVAAEAGVIEIRLASGDVIRADHGLPIERLKAIIQVLRGRC
jgi:hypothetical protein